MVMVAKVPCPPDDAGVGIGLMVHSISPCVDVVGEDWLENDEDCE